MQPCARRRTRIRTRHLRSAFTSGGGRLFFSLSPGLDMAESFHREVLEQLRELGSDPRRPHNLDLYLYLPTEAAANTAAEKVSKLHFATEVVPGSKQGTWLCRAKIRVIPESAPLDSIGAYFEQVAYEMGSDFDGWEADVVNA